MAKILVTGGAGFIGSFLVEKLISKKNKVLVVDSLKSKGTIPYINPKSIFIKGDILSQTILKKIEFWKPDIIFHLAAQSGGETAYEDPEYDYKCNGYGTYLLGTLAKKINVKNFIYTSTVAVYGSNVQKLTKESGNISPDSIYGISKYAGEMFLKQLLFNTKTKTTIFRVHNTYGPGENLNFLKKGMVSIYLSYVWQNKPIIVKGSLDRYRNLNYVDDVVNILTQSIYNKRLKKFEVINLSSSKIVKVKDLIFEILKINNLKKYKIIIKKSTPGDSFGYNSSNKILKSRFGNYKFKTIAQGLREYYKWISILPLNKKIKNYHPLFLR